MGARPPYPHSGEEKEQQGEGRLGFYHFEVDKVKGGWVIMGASPHTPFMENEKQFAD